MAFLQYKHKSKGVTHTHVNKDSSEDMKHTSLLLFKLNKEVIKVVFYPCTFVLTYGPHTHMGTMAV